MNDEIYVGITADGKKQTFLFPEKPTKENTGYPEVVGPFDTLADADEYADD